MGSTANNIVFAGLAPHPPIIVPEVGRGNERDSQRTVDAMKLFARRLVQSKPDAVVVISPHSPRKPGAFGYWQASWLSGDFSQFRAPGVKLKLPTASICQRQIIAAAEEHRIQMWPIEDVNLDHGAMVPLYYLSRAGWKGETAVFSLNYPGEGQLVEFGKALSAGIERYGKRVAIVASGDMSHRLRPGAPGGFHPDAQKFDDTFVRLLRDRDYSGLLQIDDGLEEVAGQDVMESTLIAMSALDWKAPECEVLSYEGPFGVGYCVAIFKSDASTPAEGKLLPGIAKKALEEYVRYGKTLRIDEKPEGYLAERHGAFVTIRLSDGSLRGCIGVMQPTKENLIEEVIDRAKAVAQWAYGGPVVKSELSDLVYSVSVLSDLEDVDSEDELDPAVYGVLARDTMGRQAVLLPGIESITTVEEQLEFVRKKAGIPEGEPVRLYKFTTDHFKEGTLEESPCEDQAPERPLDKNLKEGEFPARWWERLDDGRLHCFLCPRHCRIKEGQRGFCFVRANKNDRLILTTYGRSSGFCIDPIEKKPLNHFLPGTSILSFGTAGCNLGCRFCQNWDISKAREMDRLMATATPERIAEAASEHGCRSVAFTYNDPVIFAEYAIDIAKACHERDINTVAVTAGYITEQARGEFFRHMDAANIDLKGFTEEFYKKYCFGELLPVLDTLRYLKHETDVWFEITTLLIPEANDDDGEVERLCDWIMENLGPDVPIHFTAFHPDFKMMDRPPTPHATLLRARNTALSKGMNYVYVGNVHDEDAGSTYCPVCNTQLIRRDWYAINDWQLTSGKCPNCGEPISGRFEHSHGTWGPKRRPISI